MAIRALDKHAIDEAKVAVAKGLAAAEGPGIAAWLGLPQITYAMDIEIERERGYFAREGNHWCREED